MFNKIYDKIRSFMMENYKYILGLIVFYLVITYPLNYYIFTGGGISNIDSRININSNYKSSGSFNISYVSELNGNVLTYLLSYIVPSWKREKISDYKLDDDESLDDVNFRNSLDLDSTNSRSINIAYNLANKKCVLTDSKIYVTYISDMFETKLKVKDQILSINGKKYKSVGLYKRYINSLSEGDIVDVLVLRNGSKKTIKSKIYKLKDRLVLGIGLSEISNYDTNPKVNIKFTSRESGPSAGLITTLYIYNSLVKKDLTKSYKIAGTGTIEDDHSIGEVGGVEYKLLGAVNGGTDVFIVPNGDNYKTCMKIKNKDKLKIKIIGVDTIEDAIDKLDSLK